MFNVYEVPSVPAGGNARLANPVTSGTISEVWLRDEADITVKLGAGQSVAQTICSKVGGGKFTSLGIVCASNSFIEVVNSTDRPSLPTKLVVLTA